MHLYQYNLIIQSNNYSKTSGRLWQYHRDQLDLADAGAADDFPGNSFLSKFKQKTTGSAGYDGIKTVKITLPLKYFSHFWRTLQMALINSEINLI